MLFIYRIIILKNHLAIIIRIRCLLSLPPAKYLFYIIYFSLFLSPPRNSIYLQILRKYQLIICIFSIFHVFFRHLFVCRELGLTVLAESCCSQYCIRKIRIFFCAALHFHKISRQNTSAYLFYIFSFSANRYNISCKLCDFLGKPQI